MTSAVLRWYALGMVLVAAGIRWRYIGEPMRIDESYTFLAYASAPWGAALSDMTYPNNHLLNTALIKLLVGVFGGAPWVVRMPAFLAGVAIVPATAALARRLAGSAAACVAAALAAWSPSLVLYSVDGRGYAFVVLATLVGAVAGFDAIRTRRLVWWGVFVLTSALGFYAVPTMLYPFGAIVLWLALLAWRAGALGKLGLACVAVAGLTALLYAPAIAHSGVGSIVGNQYVTAEPWVALRHEMPAFVRGVVAQTAGGMPLILFAMAALVGLWVLARRDAWRAALFVIALVWSALLMLVMQRVPFVRVWIFLTPLALIVVSAGVSFLVTVRRTVVVAAAVAGCALVLGVALGGPGLPRAGDEMPDARAIARTLEPMLAPGDRLFSVLWADAPVRYYLVRDGVSASRFDTGPDSTRRLFIVVQRAVGFDFGRFAVDAPVFGRPGVVARFDDETVYRVGRLD